VPPVKIWLVALCNRDPKRWAPRGREATRGEALEHLRMALAADLTGDFDGGWIRQVWK
jgi:hypothetical protein